MADKALKKQEVEEVFALKRQDCNEGRMGLRVAGFLDQQESLFQNRLTTKLSNLKLCLLHKVAENS